MDLKRTRSSSVSRLAKSPYRPSFSGRLYSVMNFRYCSGCVGRDVLQLGENLLDAGGADAGEYAILLQDFAADVERKIFAVDDAADEAQILRQKLFGVVHDEDALHVELHADLVFRLVEIERSLRGHVEERGVFKAPFGLGVEPEERICPIAGDGFVELLVVLFRDFTLGTTPESAGGIDLFGGAGLHRLLLGLVPLALVVGEKDREGDVVGVFLYDLLQAPAIGVLLAFLVEVKKHGGAGNRALCGLDVEASLAIADPAPGFFFAGLAGDDFNAVGDHEGAVEADAKLADEIRVFLGVPGELREKVLGARAGDGAKVRDQILLIHADAGVGDGEGLVLFVEFQIDSRIERKRPVGIVGEGQVAELIKRVGGVGNELAQEDFRMRIEGVDDQLQQLIDFGLKFTFRHRCLLSTKTDVKTRSSLPNGRQVSTVVDRAPSSSLLALAIVSRKPVASLLYNRATMKLRSKLTFVSLLVWVMTVVAHAEPVSQLHATGYVNDFAHVLDQNTVAQMEGVCLQIDQKAHAQIAVVTINSLDGADVESYAVDLFKSWGIGDKSTESWRFDPVCH